MSTRSRALLYLSLLGLIWGASFLFIKICVGSIPLFTFVAGRMGMGALVLYALLRLRGDNMPRPGRTWGPFLVVGLLNALVPYTLIAWGETRISSSLAAILDGTMPIFVVVLAHYLTQDERATASKVIGVILGFLGIVVVMWPDLQQGVTFSLLGQLAVVLGTLSYAVAVIYTRRNLRGVPAMKMSIGMLSSGFVLTLPLIVLLERPLVIQPAPAAWLSWVILGVMGTAVAYLLYYWLIEHTGATYTSLVTFILPPCGVFWGALILGEQVAWEQIVGLGIIVLSIMTVNGYLERPWRRLTAPLRPASTDAR